MSGSSLVVVLELLIVILRHAQADQSSVAWWSILSPWLHDDLREKMFPSRPARFPKALALCSFQTRHKADPFPAIAGFGPGDGGVETRAASLGRRFYDSLQINRRSPFPIPSN
jgi:hypothetical protein